MSTIVTCTAVLCRHLADGVCSLSRIGLGNAEFRYEKFCRINGSQTVYGDEQFCLSFAPARSPDVSPNLAMMASPATAVPTATMPTTEIADALTTTPTTEVADALTTMPTTDIADTLTTMPTMTATDIANAHANAGT